MQKKHHEKTFEVEGINLRLKKLGLAEFPSFKMIYAASIDSKDIEGLIKAHNILYSWLEYEVLPEEWVPVYNKTEDRFVVNVLNDLGAADEIINIVMAEIITPLFLNTAE